MADLIVCLGYGSLRMDAGNNSASPASRTRTYSATMRWADSGSSGFMCGRRQSSRWASRQVAATACKPRADEHGIDDASARVVLATEFATLIQKQSKGASKRQVLSLAPQKKQRPR